MNWYDKLNTYFPVEEMKSKEQIDALLADKGDIYHKDEGDTHILMYAEFDSFVFIDFLWVSEKTRGKGIGHQLIEKMKAKNKPMILEVEPVVADDPDTKKRLRFYKREGFTHAEPIIYYHQDFITNKETQLEVLYWAKSELSEKTIFEYMKKIYEEVHAYNVEKIYGNLPKPVYKVLRFDENRKL